MARKLIVEIVGDSSKLNKTFAQASKSGKQFEGQVSVVNKGLGRLRSTVGVAAAGFIGGAGIVSVLKDSVEASSNLSEQMSKSNVVFGQSAQAVEQWAQTSVNAMGLASDQALEAASSFGALLRPLGLTGQAAADQSEKLTQLGADLASFYNTDVQSALDALRSGLVGEAEPLRRYGVLLSETRVAQEAMNETGKTSATRLTDQEKVLARLALIFRDTGQAQGDFTRTSGGLANQQRILSANIRQLEIQIGNALKPAIQDVVTQINDWLSKSENQQRVTDAVKDAVNLLTGALRTLHGILDRVNEITGSTTGTVKLFVAAWAGFKITALLQNLGLLAGAAGIGGVGRSAEVATGKVGALRAALIAPWPAVVVTIGVDILIHKNELDAWFESHNLGRLNQGLIANLSPGVTTGGRYAPGFGPSNVPQQQIVSGLEFSTAQNEHLQQVAKGARQTVKATEAAMKDYYAAGTDFATGLSEHIAQQNAAADKAGREAAKPGPSRELIDKWFDSKIARALLHVEGIRSVQGQIDALEAIRAKIIDRAKATKDVTRAHSLEDQAFRIFLQQRGLRDQLASDAASDAADAAKSAQDKAAAAADARDKATQKMLDAFGLKLSKAELTTGVRDDISVLQALQAYIRRRMREVGKTMDLQTALVDVQQQLAAKQQEQTDARKRQQAHDREALREFTRNENAYMRRLQEADRAREKAQRERQQRLQFLALGLTATGEERVPGREALQRRLAQLRKRIAGTDIDTPKVRGQLAQIGNVLSAGVKDAMGAAKKDSLRWIDDYFDSLSSGFDKAANKTGDFGQRFKAFRTGQIIRAMGLSDPAEIRRARAVLAAMGPQLSVPAGRLTAFAGAGAQRPWVAQRTIQFNGNVAFYGVQDIGQMENQITKRQAARPHNRRGAR